VTQPMSALRSGDDPKPESLQGAPTKTEAGLAWTAIDLSPSRYS